MNHIRRMLPKNRFARGVSLLVGGTASGHLVTVLSAPILTRLYHPEDFGLLAVFAALMSIISVISSLRYQSAIMLPENEEEANALFLLSLLIIVVMVTLTAIPVALFPEKIASLLNAPALADYLYLVPVGIFFIGVFHAVNVLAIRNKEFTALAKTKLSQSVATIMIQLAGSPFGTLALLTGQVAGHATGSLSIMFRILRGRWQQLVSIKPSTILMVARRYKRFPLFETWTALFNTVGAQLPSILFAILFSPAVAGIYALATRVLSAPMQLLGQAIADVFFSNATQASREGRLGELAAMIHSRLAHIVMPPVLILLVDGPEIFAHVFGPKWQQAGVFAQWFAPWLYLVLITSPLTSVFTVMNKLGTGLMFESMTLVVRIVAIIAGAYVGDVITAVAFLAVGSMVCRASMLVCLIRISGNKWSAIWQPPVNALLWSIPLGSPIILSKMWGLENAFWFLALGTAMVFIFVRYVCLVKEAWA